jgi:CheY-like chemotaxis protein
MILILDDDVGRLEVLQQLLYQHGYQTDTSGVVELEARAGPTTRLVLAYLPVPPKRLAAIGVPVLLMDCTEARLGSWGTAAVSHLSSRAGFDDLLDRIGCLIGPGSK